jgi:hypothetical protein
VLILHSSLENKQEEEDWFQSKGALAPDLVPKATRQVPHLFIQWDLVDFPEKDSRREDSSVCIVQNSLVQV